MFVIPPTLEHGSGAIMEREPDVLLLAVLQEPETDRGVETRLAARARVIDPILTALGLRRLRLDQPPRGALENAALRPMTGGEGPLLNESARLHWVVNASDHALDQARVSSALAAFREREYPLEWAAPTYRMPGTSGWTGLVCPVPDVVLVQPRLGVDPLELSHAMEAYGLEEDVGRSRLLVGLRAFRLRSLEEQSAYDLRLRIRSDHADLVESVRLENIPLLSPALAIPNDPGFSGQWNMVRIGAGGPGATGWDITTGSPDVVIGIVDTGCALGHPDLAYRSTGYDAIQRRERADESHPLHGTRVAGIACATYDNGLCVAGVAGQCLVLPVTASSDASVAEGITWAAMHEANVINLSIGLPDNGGWDFAIIDPAIVQAHHGGCVLCAATGNDNASSIFYPARHPNVMACGASDRSDERWVTGGQGSNYGYQVHAGVRTGVSVVAPGIAIPTLMPGGGQGIFSMTSAATPHVSGLAALLMSLCHVDPDEVREIIERTADRVGTVAYREESGFPNGTRNPETGYGRINVAAALELACRRWPSRNQASAEHARRGPT